jgi:hypothetical protein
MVTTKAFERSIVWHSYIIQAIRAFGQWPLWSPNSRYEGLAREAGTDQETARKVLEAAKAKEESRRRQPAPPPPPGSISQSAASRKYGIGSATISRWASAGYIPIVLRTRREVYIDEAKLLKVINCFKKSPGQGKKTVKRKFAS